MTQGPYDVKRGDTHPPIRATLKDENGPAPLTGAAVTFFMKQVEGRKYVSGTGTIVDASAGKVEYQWVAGDTNTPGIYRGEFEVRFAPGTVSETVETFPSGEYLEIRILEDLG